MIPTISLVNAAKVNAANIKAAANKKTATIKDLEDLKAQIKAEAAAQEALRLSQWLKDKEKFEIEKARTEAKINILYSIVKLREAIETRRGKWIGPNGVSTKIGGAYIGAFRSFNDTHTNQAQWDAFMSQLLFSALAVSATGALGWVFNNGGIPYPKRTLTSQGNFELRWQKTSFKHLVGPDLQDVLKEVTDKSVESIGAWPKPVEVRSDDAIPEPMQFQFTLEARLNEQFEFHQSFLRGLLDLFEKTTFKPGSDKTYKVIIKMYLDIMDMPIFRPPENLDRQEIAKQLEIGLWAGWLAKKGRAFLNAGGNIHQMAKADFNMGMHIQSKLRSLGIFSLAQITENRTWVGNVPTGPNFDQLQKLINWAEKYTPSKTFG